MLILICIAQNIPFSSQGYEGPLSAPRFYFMHNIWQDAGNRTRVAFTAARCAINELHKIHSFSFTGQLWCAIFSFNSLWVRLHHKALTELFTNFAEFPAATFVWHYALIIYCLFLAYFAFSSNIKKGSVSCIMLAMACVAYCCILLYNWKRVGPVQGHELGEEDYHCLDITHINRGT